MRNRTLYSVTTALVSAFLAAVFVLFGFLVERHFGRPWVGISFERQHLKEHTTIQPLGINIRPGTILSVVVGSPAYKQGLRPGDQVLAIDGIPVSDSAKIVAHLDRLPPGHAAEYAIRSAKTTRFVSLAPEIPLQWSQTILSLVSSAVTAFLFLLVGGFVLARKWGDFRAMLLFLVCALTGSSYLYFPLLSFPESHPFGLQAYSQVSGWFIPTIVLVVLSALILPMVLLHLTVSFPRKLRWIAEHPPTIRWIYLTLPAVYLGLIAGIAVCTGTYETVGTSEWWIPFSLIAVVVLVAPAWGWAFVRRRRGEGFFNALADHPWQVVGLVLSVFLTICYFGALTARWLEIPGPELLNIAWVALLALMFFPAVYPVASCIALYLEYRQAGPEERLQVRWPIWGTFAALSGSVLTGLVSLGAMALGRVPTEMALICELVGKGLYLLIPVSFAVGILKYRLMDIRVLIRRTVTYAVVTFLVLLVFFSLAGGVGGLLAHFAGVQSTWSIVVSTLGAVALVMPVHNRVQRFLDRRFFRVRYHRPELLAALQRKLQACPEKPLVFRESLEFVRAVLPVARAGVFSRSSEDSSFRLSDAFGVEAASTSQGRYRVFGGKVLPLAAAGLPPASLEERLPEGAGEEWAILAELTVEDGVVAVLAAPVDESAEALGGDELTCVRHAAALVSQTLERLKLREQSLDLERALEIQRSLLPTAVPPVPGGVFYAYWKPSRSVGGDLYDLVPFGDGRIGLTIADVSGKGMSAAIIMSNLQAVFRAIADPGAAPDAVCRRLNQSAASLLKDGRFVTLFYGVYDSGRRLLTYCNAGHCPPLLVRRDGGVERLSEGGTVLGVLPEAVFQCGEATLGPGDCLILYTDGLTEAAPPDGDEYGDSRLEALCRQCGRDDPRHLVANLVRAVLEHGGGELQDDLTLLVLSVGEGDRLESQRGEGEA